MPDERQDSIRQGMGAPRESPSGQAAAEEQRQRGAGGPAIGGELGGTSDSEGPADEAQLNAAMNASDDLSPSDVALEERARVEEDSRADEDGSRR